MNDLTVFQSDEFGEVRTTEVNGEIWFVASDICRALEISNVSDAVSKLDEDEKMTIANTESHQGKNGGAQKLNIINEAGLYSVILRSRKPEAKRFKRWITHEIMPSIRKTGGYVQVNREQEFLDNWLSRLTDGTKNTIIKELTFTNEKLQEERDNLAKDNAVYKGEIFDWGERKKLNYAIRRLASMSGKPFGVTWNNLYRELSYRWGIDLKKRGSSPYIKHIKEKEWQYVLRTLTAMCEDENTTLVEVMKNVKGDFDNDNETTDEF